MTTAEETTQDPTNCDRCRASLERGWSERWIDGVRAHAVCFACNTKEYRAEYEASDIFTTKIMTDAAIYGVRLEYGRESPDPLLDRALRDTQAIQTAAKTFERDVWFAGLQDAVRKATTKGSRATFAVGGVPCVLLAWACAGRVVFTFEPEDESYQVTLITAEDEARSVMGIQGVRATRAQAVALIDAATAALRGGVGFTRDDKVDML